ncbi:MAG: DUF1302 family protein [Pseudomonadota bacterium]
MRTKMGLCGFLLIALVQSNLSLSQDVTVQGFIRLENAPKLNSDENPFNQNGNLFNDRTVNRDSSLLGGAADTVTRAIPDGSSQPNNWHNYLALRAEIDINAYFNDSWTGYVKLRGLYQPDSYDSFGDPNFYEVPFFNGDSAGSRLEIAGSDYMLDLPAFYLDYAKGPLWLRIGNQQIAWGESLFFRVLDVPNGLDLRRHLILDLVAEEFADERVSAPGIRGSIRAGDWEFEAFAQMFSPSIIPNENTPYNLVPSQFVVQQQQGFDDAKDDINFGARIQGQIGDLGLQFIAVHRTNPDGVFRWTTSNVNRDLPGVPGSGFVLQDTAFEVSNQGVLSAEEWFTYAGITRLDGVQGLNRAIGDFPATALLGAVEVGDNFDLAAQELDLFFQLSGGLRGHIERRYFDEEVYGVGANYIFKSEAGSFLDQLVVRGELTFTPDRTFTSPDLGRDFLVEDEWVGSLVLEKYHRFNVQFPATFMVLQYLYKSESDLAGRHLSGFGGGVSNTPSGESSFQALAFAVQQPFPNLVWRADLSVLYDLNGGTLIQPNVRWKPNNSYTLEVFANILTSDGGNDDIIEPLEWGDELGIRFSYQF